MAADAPSRPSGATIAVEAGATRVRGPRASSVIVQRFPADHADAFMDWLHGTTDAAGAFPGCQATEVYPPAGVSDADADDELGGDHPFRRRADAPGVARRAGAGDFRMHTMPAGFGSWIAGQTADGTPVPHGKSILLVLVGLHPAGIAWHPARGGPRPVAWCHGARLARNRMRDRGDPS